MQNQENTTCSDTDSAADLSAGVFATSLDLQLV